MRIDSATGANSSLTGSFLSQNGVLSSSAQIASEISGSSTSLSSSLASRVTTEENNVDVLQAHQSNIHAFTASADSEITSLMGATSSYAAKTAVSGAFTSTSASIASDIASNLSNITSIGSFTASLDSDITTFSLPASTTISTFGKSLVDDADAATARTTLDVDQAGTDNSTDVTLVTTSHDYLSLAGQAITLGTIDISDDTNLAASTGITLTGDTLTTNDSQIVHDNLSGFVADEHVAHSGVSITAGAGLTGGGTIAATRTINVGAGTGVTVNADNVAIGQSVATTADVTFGSVAVTNDVTISGDLVVLGNATELQVSALNVEDINITIASGAADSAAANGAGITIAGANETLTWDHGNSRFSFSDDLNVTGNITLSGTVDGRDIASDGGKLDGIEAGADVTDTANVTAAGALMDSEVDADIKTLSLPASTTISTFGASLVDDADAATARTTLGVDAAGTVNYSHPTHPGDDFSVDTGALTGATVVSDIDINVTTDTLGHVTDANGSVATRTLTLADLGYTGTTDANTYVHPTHPGDDISIDTGALTGATVISDLDFNVTTDTLGHVTDANATVATRNITLANLGYTGATNADNYSSWTIKDGDTTTYTITSGDTLQIAAGAGISSNFTADDVLTITNTITNNNQLTNGAGYTTNVGDITGVTAGVGLSGGGSSGDVTLTLDMSELTDMTATMVGTDEFIVLDSGADRRKAASEIGLSIFNNDSGYTTYTANQTLDNNDNVHFEGLMVGQTTGATANTIRCVGDIVAFYSSDRKFKDNIVPLEGALDKVKAIRGVRFDWNDKQDVHEGHDIGVIAQEVEAVLPELVHYREHNDSKAVDYVKLTAVLIEAVKELSAKVDELTK